MLLSIRELRQSTRMEGRAVNKKDRDGSRTGKRTSQVSEIWRRFRKNRAAMAGLIILSIIVFFTLFADLIVPYSKCIDQVGAERLQWPSMRHIFGTEIGRAHV